MATKTAKPTKKRSFGTRIVLLLNWIAVIALLLAYLAGFLNPSVFWPAAFLGLLYPAILIINILFILFWIVYLKRYFLISLLAIVIGYSYFNTFFSTGRTRNNRNSEKDIKVMSYNVRLFNLYSWEKKGHREMRQAILDLISSESPDILCIQEFYSGHGLGADYGDTISRILRTKYRHEAFVVTGNRNLPVGLATFSKYPIINSSKVPYENSNVNFFTVNDIVVEDDTFRIINTHMESVRFGKEDISFVSDWNSINDTTLDYQKGSKIILRKIKRAFVRRADQIPTTLHFIKQSPYPVIFCGDINDTPASYTYKQLTNELDDSFVLAGHGIGQTYSDILPWLRIDYIMTSRSLSASSFQVIKKSYSDHYPVVANIHKTDN